MKSIISFILAVLLNISSLFAQNIEIKTIQDINSFNSDTVDNLYIHNTTGLSSIYGFESLKLVRKDLIISGNEATSLSGFDNLITVSGSIIIEDNELLTTVNAFHNLKQIGKRLSLTGINSSEITGFSSLTQVLEVIISNCSLKNIDFLSQLESVERGIKISENDSLLNINSFSNLSVTGYIEISDNFSLANLQGFSSLKSASNINLFGNASLVNLSGLEGLNTLSSYLFIWQNPALESIRALKNLSSLGGDLAIHDNINLSECSMISVLLTTPDAIKGNVEIYNNKPGCDYASLYTNIPINPAQSIEIYPNPTCSESIIRFNNSNSGYSLRIYNMNGNLVHSYQNINPPLTIQWKDEQRGIYYYQISTLNRVIQSGKIVVE